MSQDALKAATATSSIRVKQEGEYHPSQLHGRAKRMACPVKHLEQAARMRVTSLAHGAATGRMQGGRICITHVLFTVR